MKLVYNDTLGATSATKMHFSGTKGVVVNKFHCIKRTYSLSEVLAPVIFSKVECPNSEHCSLLVDTKGFRFHSSAAVMSCISARKCQA